MYESLGVSSTPAFEGGQALTIVFPPNTFSASLCVQSFHCVQHLPSTASNCTNCTLATVVELLWNCTNCTSWGHCCCGMKSKCAAIPAFLMEIGQSQQREREPLHLQPLQRLLLVRAQSSPRHPHLLVHGDDHVGDHDGEDADGKEGRAAAESNTG